jgi:hypothetical protein
MFAVTRRVNLILTREAQVGIALAIPVLISGGLLLFAAAHHKPTLTDGQDSLTEVSERKLSLEVAPEADALAHMNIQKSVNQSQLEQSQK